MDDLALAGIPGYGSPSQPFDINRYNPNSKVPDTYGDSVEGLDPSVDFIEINSEMEFTAVTENRPNEFADFNEGGKINIRDWDNDDQKRLDDEDWLCDKERCIRCISDETEEEMECKNYVTKIGASEASVKRMSAISWFKSRTRFEPGNSNEDNTSERGAN